MYLGILRDNSMTKCEMQELLAWMVGSDCVARVNCHLNRIVLVPRGNPVRQRKDSTTKFHTDVIASIFHGVSWVDVVLCPIKYNTVKLFPWIKKGSTSKTQSFRSAARIRLSDLTTVDRVKTFKKLFLEASRLAAFKTSAP